MELHFVSLQVKGFKGLDIYDLYTAAFRETTATAYKSEWRTDQL